jgi:hypothetical protein
MRPDITFGAVFPDYELSDHTGKHRKLSELQGPHPMILVLSRGGFCPQGPPPVRTPRSIPSRDRGRLHSSRHLQHRQPYRDK